MDSESYEQLTIPVGAVAEALRWMKESSEIDVLYIDDRPADIQLPSATDLAVAETEPGLRGDTASGGGNKPATLETGSMAQQAHCPRLTNGFAACSKAVTSLLERKMGRNEP